MGKKRYTDTKRSEWFSSVALSFFCPFNSLSAQVTGTVGGILLLLFAFVAFENIFFY